MRLLRPNGLDFDTLRREFRWEIPERYNIGVDICDKHHDRLDQTAIFYENAAGNERRLSFGELKSSSNRLANALRALGVERGDRVGIILSQRPETVIAHIALYKLGAVTLPLSILFGPDALEYRLQNSGAKAVITDHEHTVLLQDMQATFEHLETIVDCDADTGKTAFRALHDAASDEFEPVATLSDDPALLIYTSGTTGPPKGALSAQRCLLGNLPGFELSHEFFPHDGDCFWTPADWAWTGGLLDALVPALRYGVPVVAYEGGKFDPEKACHIMAKYAVRNAFIPPTALKMLMQVPDIPGRFDLRTRSIMAAGESLGSEVFAWSKEHLGITVNEMWGQTEFNYLVGNCSSIMPIKPGSMGKPYPGHNVEVIDEQGQPVADGEHGQLAARCDDPVMFLGYWNNEEATREKIIGDWFCTGDVGFRDDDGYLWYVGRSDDVISSAGHRVGPGEVEDSLLKHPAVAQAAVIGAPDKLRGSIIKAFIVLARGHKASDTLAHEIQESVKTRLAAHEYPRAIEFIEELPMTTTGKIRRIELRKRGDGVG